MARLYDYLMREGLIDDPESSVRVIVADYIQQEINNDPREDYQWQREDFLCVAPPFPHFFVEARVPFEENQGDFFVGIACWAGSEENSTDFKEIQSLLADGNPEFMEARWIFSMTPFAKARFATVFPMNMFIAIGDEGQLLTDPERVPVATSQYGKQYSPEEVVWLGTSRVPLLLKTLNFLNLANVEMVDVVPPPALSKSARKKYGHELVEYKELVVTGKNTVNLSRLERQEIAERRAHEVRGHIKHRKTGNFYWRPHARGSKDKGEIKKTYRVQGNE